MEDENSTSDDVIPAAERINEPIEEHYTLDGSYTSYVNECNAFRDVFDAPLPVFTIDDWQRYIHATALEKGWWKGDREPLEVLALIHSEISEACEDFRDDEPPARYEDDGKPVGWAIELIDAMIRILDFLGANQVRTGVLMAEKTKYNDSREYRHGGKKH